MDQVLSQAVSKSGVPPCGKCELCLKAIATRNPIYAVGCHERYADEYPYNYFWWQQTTRTTTNTTLYDDYEPQIDRLMRNAHRNNRT